MPSSRTVRSGFEARYATPFVAALAGIAVLVFADIVGGSAGLTNARGDNDSLMRMVQVHDLLAGQGWFDLTQYRMGPEGGFVMHWSRLVDAPLALMVAVFTALTGDALAAETIASILWPILVFGGALYFLVRAATGFGGPAAMLPTTVIGTISLFSIGMFSLGDVDHHNIQFLLTVATIYFLIRLHMPATGSALSGAAAGACAGLSLAVGMETAPYVAAAGLVVAGGYLVLGERAARGTAGFGLAFAGTALLATILTIAPSRWFSPACDAFSLAQSAIAVVSGVALAIAVSAPIARRSWRGRALALAGVGGATILVLLVFFPQCLAAPYADVDIRQKIYWLDHVRETESAWSLVHSDPAVAAGFFATPLLGLIVSLLAAWRSEQRTPHLIAGAFLLVAILTGVWQVRGALFAVGIAVLPLGVWVGKWRSLQAAPSLRHTVKPLLAWLFSINLTWAAAASGLEIIVKGQPATSMRPDRSQGGACGQRADYRELAALPKATVMSGVNIGAPILRYTHHRAIAGPYHRNPGNILAYAIETGDLAKVPALLAQNGIGLIAVCRTADESPDITRTMPDSLHARLMRGEPPGGFEIVPASKGQAIEIYRILPLDQ